MKILSILTFPTQTAIRETNAHLRRVLEQDGKPVGPRHVSGQFVTYDPKREEQDND